MIWVMCRSIGYEDHDVVATFTSEALAQAALEGVNGRNTHSGWGVAYYIEDFNPVNTWDDVDLFIQKELEEQS